MNIRKIELHDTQADPLDIRIEHLSVGVDQFAFGFVQGRFSVPPRPPQVGLFEVHDDPSGMREQHLLTPVGFLAVTRQRKTDFRLVVLIERQSRLEINEQTHVARSRIDVRRHPIDVGETRRIERAQFDAAPQSGAHQTGHDVPAVHVRRLADIDRFFGREITHAERAEQVTLRAEHNRTDDNLYRIAAALFDQIGHVETALDQHIGRRARMFAVDPDVGQAVDPAEPEFGALSGLQFRSVEPARIAPLVTLPGAQFIHVGSDHRVIDQAGGQQVEFDVTGHLRRNGFHFDPGKRRRIGHGFFGLGPVREFPLAVQRNRSRRRSRARCGRDRPQQQQLT